MMHRALCFLHTVLLAVACSGQCDLEIDGTGIEALQRIFCAPEVRRNTLIGGEGFDPLPTNGSATNNGVVMHEKALRNNIYRWKEQIGYTVGQRVLMYSTEHFEHFKKFGGCLTSPRYGFAEVQEGLSVHYQRPGAKVETRVVREADGQKARYFVFIHEWDCAVSLEDCKPVRENARYKAVLFAQSFDGPNAQYPKLGSAKREAVELGTLLHDAYGFDTMLVVNAPRDQMYAIIGGLASEPCDANVLLFFTGHGAMNQGSRAGFWAASNSEPGRPETHLSYLDVRSMLSGFAAGHVLIISDVCYGGSLLKDQLLMDCFPQERPDLSTVFGRRSRTALTSGDLTVVPERSYFFLSLMAELSKPDVKTLRTADLFKGIQVRMDDAPPGTPAPQYDCLRDVGHMPGGDFVFQRRQR